MTLVHSKQMPPPPFDAWGAFFEHFDKEIAAGRETQASVRAIHERAHDLDWDAHMSKYRCPPPALIIRCNSFGLAMEQMMEEIRREIRASMVSKVPFWAKKWRGSDERANQDESVPILRRPARDDHHNHLRPETTR